MPFPPGYYYKDGEFVCYRDISYVPSYSSDDLETVCKNIHDKLMAGVEKRLDSDVPVGFLLSGGLDSSLVCAIAAHILKKPIRTFAIGMSEDAIDLKYAPQTADYIGCLHTPVIITKETVLAALEDVIKAEETFDITTIRAGVGMYLVCKYILMNTLISKSSLQARYPSELFGYKYTDFAPDAEAFQEEAEKRLRELYMYDVYSVPTDVSLYTLWRPQSTPSVI